MPKNIIFAGAHIDDYEWLEQQVSNEDEIICADSGLRHAHAIGVTPNIIIGDFDSVDPTLLESYKEKSKIINDDDQNTTDLMKALAQCDHSKPVHIYCAVGERADHDFSNYLILMNMERPDNIAIITKTEIRRVVKSSITLNGDIGDKIGVFPLSPVNGLLFNGLKYPSHALPHAHEFGWNGACNEMTHKSATIQFNDGTLLITQSKGN